jgi:DHA1 family tetracycline resistance protein-like MFS transporter
MKLRSSPIFVVFMIVFIDLVGFGIIIPLGPYYATNLGATATQVGLMMTIYSLMQFLFSPFWGKLSDKVGRRPILLMSLFGSGISYLIFAFSTHYWMLILARALAGFFGANISTAMAYIADVTDEKNRSKGMGLIGAAFGLGFIMGPAIGGILSEIGLKLGDQPPFGIGFSALGASVICLANFLFAVKVLKESLTDEKKQKIQPRESRYILTKKFLSTPTQGILILMMFITTFAFAHMEATLALFVKDGWGWDFMKASFAFAYVGVISVFTQGYLIRKLMPKYGEPPLMFTGLVFSAVGMLGISLSTEVWMLGVSVTLMGLGTGMFNPSNLGSISLSSSAQDQGKALGVSHSFSALGRILGPLSGGFIYGNIGKRYPFMASSLVLIIGFFILYRIRKTIPNSTKIKKASAFTKIGEYQLTNLLSNPIHFLMLDLRSENKNPHIKKSQTINLENILEFVQKNSPTKDMAIVVVCEDGTLSTQAAEIISSNGYINVVVLEGGTKTLTPHKLF